MSETRRYQREAGDYQVLDSGGTARGLVCKRDDGWQSWIYRPERNMKLGTFRTRREAADEIDIERAGS